MSYYKMAFNCRVNPSFNRVVKHVINAINHILKTIFQTAECGNENVLLGIFLLGVAAAAVYSTYMTVKYILLDDVSYGVFFFIIAVITWLVVGIGGRALWGRR